MSMLDVALGLTLVAALVLLAVCLLSVWKELRK